MEDYLGRFHQIKDILLEFRVSKCTQAKIDKERKELRRQRAQINQLVATSKWCRVRDEDREEQNNWRMEWIQSESRFNFIKMYLLIHFNFREHIQQFGNILLDYTECGELAHKDQIKNSWRGSNKNDVARQICRATVVSMGFKWDFWPWNPFAVRGVISIPTFGNTVIHRIPYWRRCPVVDTWKDVAARCRTSWIFVGS